MGNAIPSHCGCGTVYCGAGCRERVRRVAGLALFETSRCDLRIDDLRPGIRVALRLPALDARLCRLLEPGGESPGRRLLALRRLRREGIPAGILLGPVVPGLNDRLGLLQQAAVAAAQSGALWLSARPLVLPGRVRGRFLAWLRRERPRLWRSHRRLWRSNGRPPRLWEERLRAMVEAVRVQEGLAAAPDGFAAGSGQLALPFAGTAVGAGYPVGSEGGDRAALVRDAG